MTVTVTEDDLTAALRTLYTESRPEREEGEFTVDEYLEANRDRLKDRGEAENQLDYLLRTGKLTKRRDVYINSRLRVVYKVCETLGKS